MHEYEDTIYGCGGGEYTCMYSKLHRQSLKVHTSNKLSQWSLWREKLGRQQIGAGCGGTFHSL